MNRISSSLAVVALGTALFGCSAASQGTVQGGAKLEAQGLHRHSPTHRRLLSNPRQLHEQRQHLRGPLSLTTQPLACLRSGAAAPRSGFGPRAAPYRGGGG
jgi:hypothetical protein